MSVSKKVEISEYVIEKLMINDKARKWCLLPYPDHPKGCPNYNKKAECPPQAPVIEDFLHLGKKMWFIVAKFNLKDHADRMKKKHPNWSDKQARCVLYWQGTVRKHLREACEKFIQDKPLVFTLLPEAMGVQVIHTAKKLNIPIETKPKIFVHKIALIGYPKKEIIMKKTLLDFLS